MPKRQLFKGNLFIFFINNFYLTFLLTKKHNAYIMWLLKIICCNLLKGVIPIMKLGFLLNQRLEENLIKVTPPEKINVTFSSLFGVEKAVEVLQDVITYFKSSSPKIQPHKSYFIYGPLGSGKASLIYATAKAAKIPVIDFNASIFTSLNDDNEVKKKFKLIFKTTQKLTKQFKGCAIMFRNMEEIEDSDNDNAFYLNMIRYFSNMPNVFIFALSSTSDVGVPPIVKEMDLFATAIGIDYPNLAVREKIFESCIKRQKINLDPNVSINRLAKEAIGETPLSIAYIVKEAHLFSLRQKHEAVTQSDFSETMMRISSGEKNFKMTEKERRLTAYHEAGHVIAGYFNNPSYVLSRVEISPRSQGSLGLTVSEIDENKYSYFREDFENRIIEFFGGLCAEEVIYGKHTSGVISDLTMATVYASNIVKVYGMERKFGFTVVMADVSDSLHNRTNAEILIKEILDELYAKTMEIISAKRPYLEALTEALVEKELVLGNEIEEIFKKVTAELEKNATSTPHEKA